MDTAKLKKFAQFARRGLIERVSNKLKLALAEESAARRESAEAVRQLENQITDSGEAQVVEKVAYIWFNRFCALRFMDANRYTRIGVVSPAEGQFQPEMLAEAKMGHIDEEMAPEKTRRQIFALLDGKAPSRDPQGEAYRLLVVAACNFWHKTMPFLFQRIDDYTELLLPDDLLSANSILAATREAMTPDACEDVEIIGWLYQFYISEKKDEVFEGLKKNKKITPENIPAATQLFTPHWIVRYLVENSLGRLWLLNRPGSKLAEKMDYYIKPEQAETDFLRIGKPEEIKICDPACGSGHMLTYAFDLLHAIYEEEGYQPAEIPEKILTHNLYGIEIDERAGELAAFALTMKARAKQRRFFNKGIKPNIRVLSNVRFDEGELKNYMDFVGRDLFTVPLQITLRQFEEADNFGSLIRPDITDVDAMLRILESKNVSGQLFLSKTHKKVLQVLRQADYLRPKYHVVIANPPYMGGKGMNGKLVNFVKDNFSDAKADLFAAFLSRIVEIGKKHGEIGAVTPYVWMFLSSYEDFRHILLKKTWITSLTQLEYNAFAPATIPVCLFTFHNSSNNEAKGVYIRLTQFRGSENQGPKTLQAIQNVNVDWRFTSTSKDFETLPGAPIAYWITESTRQIFARQRNIGSFSSAKQGLITGDNNRFIRLWHEVDQNNIDVNIENREQAQKSSKKWFPFQKGGEYRKWYGNHEYLVNWSNDGEEIRNFVDEKGKLRSRPQSIEYYFLQGITWTSVTIAAFNCRLSPPGFIYSEPGPILYSESTTTILYLSGFLNSSVANYILQMFAPGMHYNQGHISQIPEPPLDSTTQKLIIENASVLKKLGYRDWNFSETSWDFTSLPLLNPDYRQPTLKATYHKLRAHWREMTLEMRRLEEENNRIFIDAYGLQDELTPEVPLNEITLTCNPHYRYSGDKSEEELEALLLADTMREFLSYAVGCMFGRYALDKPGLVLANQGETIDDYFNKLGNHLDAWIKPESVSFSSNIDPTCFSCGKAMNLRDARFILRRYEPDKIAGRPMVYCPDCCKDRDHNMSVNIPLSEFSYSRALLQNWTSRGTLDIFLELAGCFNYSTCSPNDAVLFPADDDNVIPILDGDWFIDDIAERFRQFLRVTFGEEHYSENLAFIENALGKDIRKHFLKDFYPDHIKRYKKRPIYWLFSSPKGGFNALIYLHRYHPDTVSVVLNGYLREFRAKLTSRRESLEQINASASPAEKTRAIKEIEQLKKMLAELEDYERDVLYPLASKQLAIDLDDGVKVNYLKFGAALKKIPGLDAKGED